MSEVFTHDRTKCELRIMGKRYVAIDAQALCDHLDLVVGSKVAAVIMNQHKFRLGKEDAAKMRAERPQATVREILDAIAAAHSISGMGITKVVTPDGSLRPIELEISNPCLKRTSGASGAFVFSYWCGVLACLLGKEFNVNHAAYDEGSDLLTCQIVPRQASRA